MDTSAAQMDIVGQEPPAIRREFVYTRQVRSSTADVDVADTTSATPVVCDRCRTGQKRNLCGSPKLDISRNPPSAGTTIVQPNRRTGRYPTAAADLA